MSLFPVQRYLGDKESEDANKGKIGEKNMCKLLAKINERSKLQKRKTKSSNEHPFKKIKVKSEPSEVQNQAVINEDRSLDDKEKLYRRLSPKHDSSEMSIAINKLKIEDNEHEENTVPDPSEVQHLVNENTESLPKENVFPVIGDFKFKKKNKVKRVLPDWLANPSVVSVDLKHLEVAITDVQDLHESFITCLKKNNITHFFPVQAQVIPWLLKSTRQATFFWPCDICVSAPTGSGKTLAYVLPILQALMDRRVGAIQALVVLPVQDLAAQVASVFRAYSAGSGVRVHLSSGATPLAEDRSQLLRERLGSGWESLVDVLVTTPGRLVEHLYTTPGFSLTRLQYIVIDEADRIVDSMQNDWLHHLDQHLRVQGCPLLTLHNLRTLPRRPQKLLFSATLSIDPEKLNQLHLFQPRLFTSVVEATKDTGAGADGEFVGKFTTPAELREYQVRCMLGVKPLVLYQLISRHSWTRVLVFTSSSRSGHQLTALLSTLSQGSLIVQEISAECSPNKRKEILASFADGKIDVLVSTDALARGMDIPWVQYVISYDMPKFVKAYIHRVGRTSRAGQPGTAVTMVTHSQVGLFNQLLQTAGKQDVVTELIVSEEELKNLEEPFRNALKKLKNTTEGEEMKRLQETKMSKRVAYINQAVKKRKKNKGIKTLKKVLKTKS